MEHNLNIQNGALFHSDSIKIEASPFEVLSSFGVSEDDVVADIGCGKGNFTIPLGKLISKNKIYALDVSEKMLDEVDKRAMFSELNNIITIKTDDDNLKLESASINFALLCDVIQEVQDKKVFLAEVGRILKANGKLAFFNHSMECEEHQVKTRDLISIDSAKDLLAKAGFNIEKIYNFSQSTYGILAVKM
ncbi:class I SAM-dependent methyltransferase [Clostridium manihotivorum]|nr:methyltransferase domain-containing protein [Clostridium manihotivorum]